MENPNTFVDSDVLYAINDKSDILYRESVDILRQLLIFNPIFYISTNIISETVTLINQRVSKVCAIKLLNNLRSDRYKVIHPDESLILAAEEIFVSSTSKNVSYSDCISFAVMKHLGISLVLSFDVHFKKQGFKRVGIDTKL